jgi:excisionase family DNA binding protein
VSNSGRKWLAVRNSGNPGGRQYRAMEAGHVERQTVSIMKACELVGVSRRTIYNWIAAGKVEYVRTAGGSIRIFVDTLWRHPDGTSAPAPNLTA